MRSRVVSVALGSALLWSACAGGSGTTGPAWERPRAPILSALPGTVGISAESCGTCHTEIAREWAATTHAHAWVDPQFQAELAKDPEVGWLCINCHTPMSDQQAELAVATGEVRSPRRSPNPQFDVQLQQEGISCLSCHWRDGAIAAPHEGVQAPHPTVYAPDLLTEGLCTSCHQAVARYEDALVCTFNTGVEWTDAAPGRACPACHMPRITRASAPGAPEREGGRHLWPGSLIPKDRWSAEEEALFADWKPGIEVALHLPAPSRAGEQVHVTLDYSNARAGHLLPTGDPERYLEISLRALDGAGAPLGEATARVGQRWEWWPVAKKLEDNRLKPGESRTLGLDLVLSATGATVEYQVDHVRLSPENAAFHDLVDYPTRRTVVSGSSAIEALPPTPTGG